MTFPWLSTTSVVFHDFPGLENVLPKFQDFPWLSGTSGHPAICTSNVSRTFKSVEVLESLTLVHVGVQYKRTASEQSKHRVESPNAVLAVSEHQRPAGELPHQVVEVEVLVLQCTREPSLSQWLGRALATCHVDQLGFLTDSHRTHQRLCNQLS